jgi:pimeloyl-ACP methyl ester carboxylesterase
MHRLFDDTRYNLFGPSQIQKQYMPESISEIYNELGHYTWQEIDSDNNVVYENDENTHGNLSTIKSYTVVPALFPARVVLTPFVDGYGVTTWRNLKRRAYASVRIEPDTGGADVLAKKLRDATWSGSGPCDYASLEASKSVQVNIQEIAEKLEHVKTAISSDPILTMELVDIQNRISNINMDFSKGGLQTNHGPPPDGAFGRFAANLVSLMNREIPTQYGLLPNVRYGDMVRLDLVGHSMGGIIVNELIHELPCMQLDNLVYLGSAASLNHFDKTVLPYLMQSKNKKTKVYFAALHPLNESNEDFSDYVPAIPRGSLLHWIDTMYEPSSRYMDKTMGSWSNMALYRRQIPEEAQRERMIFKIFGFDPDLPQRHSELNDVICKDRNEACSQKADIRFAYWDSDSWGTSALSNDRLKCLSVGSGQPFERIACGSSP